MGVRQATGWTTWYRDKEWCVDKLMGLGNPPCCRPAAFAFSGSGRRLRPEEKHEWSSASEVLLGIDHNSTAPALATQ